MQRDTLWKSVWTERDDGKTDWNGFEQCFTTVADYEDWVGQVAGFISETLRLEATDRVADLGCGTGRVAKLVNRSVRSVTAFDYSTTALNVARKVRAAANIEYLKTDLNTVAPAELGQFEKAYAVGSFLYLSSISRAVELVTSLTEAGTDVLLIDLPDADRADDRKREYDQTVYSHLAFTRQLFRAQFPRSEFFRDRFPSYINDAVRFSVLIPRARGSGHVATSG